MTDLLTPDEVRQWQKNLENVKAEFAQATIANLLRLCGEYLTLWERNKELETRWYEAKHPND